MADEAKKKLFKLVKLNRTKPGQVQEILQTHQLDINVKNSWGETLIYNCCKHAVNVPLLDWLHAQGCDATLVNCKKLNAYNACLKWNHKKNNHAVLDWLMNKQIPLAKEYENYPPLHNMIICYQHPSIFDWIAKNFDLNTMDQNGNTALHITCHQDTKHNVPIPCRRMCEMKEVNVNCVNLEGQTPLHLAALSGFSTCITILLEHGADRTLLDNKKRTALDVLQENKENIIQHKFTWPGDYHESLTLLTQVEH